MSEKKYSILIIDDTPANIRILTEHLGTEYETYFAKNGAKGLEMAKQKNPDLILLDVVMPEMDGYEVCRRLKQDPDTMNIPVIFVTAMHEEDDETTGFAIGAVDYVAKPFKPAIIKSRVKTHLQLKSAMEDLKRLYNLALDANPITGLPGNNSIAAKIGQAILNQEEACVIYIDLDNFKAFNDKYGFAKGDAVIIFTSAVLKQAIKTAGCTDAFVGHVGGDDFVLVVPAGNSRDVAKAIIEAFDKDVVQFYSPDDLSSGCIEAVDRRGCKQTFPIMSISMAGVDLSSHEYDNYLQVSDVCACLKKTAKARQGSCICMDRRHPHDGEHPAQGAESC